MGFLAEVTKSNIDDYLEGYDVIACMVRNSRLRAKRLALLEMVFAQFDNGVLAVKNGPLGDVKGVITFLCPKKNLAAFREKLPFVGYCHRFCLLDFGNETGVSPAGLNSINPLVWKGRKFSVRDFYTQDDETYERHSPHNREFRIADGRGGVRKVLGYRGDGSELGRRALPVEDARCMVNLSFPGRNKRMLDPFAGAGGIIHEFRRTRPDGTMTSMDIDPVLKPGLEFYGADHHVMDARDASFPADSFDSVITEVPFSRNAVGDIVGAMERISASLSDGGVFVLMCGAGQTVEIHGAMAGMGNRLLFAHDLDRKGTTASLGVWRKGKKLPAGMEASLETLGKVR